MKAHNPSIKSVVVKRRNEIVQNNIIVLKCEKIKEHRHLIKLSGVLNGEEVSSKTVLQGSASVSTCLSQFIGYYFQDKLSVLKPHCSEMKVGKVWHHLECSHSIYGIYFDKRNGVQFYERVGMKVVKEVLTLIGIGVNVIGSGETITTIEIVV